MLETVATTGLGADEDTYNGYRLLRERETAGYGTYTYNYYDPDNGYRLTHVSNGYVTEKYTYSNVGNLTSTTISGSGNKKITTSSGYSADGNLLTSVTDANASTVTYTYGDANSRMLGLPTAVTAPNGTVTNTVYDTYSRVTQTSVANLATLLYTYDDGYLSAITRRDSTGKEQVYTLTSDDFGKTTAIRVGDRLLASYAYEQNNGPLTMQTYGNGETVSYEYDHLGRVSKMVYSSGLVLTYAYSGEGYLSSVTETKGDNTTKYLYSYDTNGRVIASERLDGGESVLRTRQSYDSVSRLDGQILQMGADTYSESYTYNSTIDGSVNTVTLKKGNTTLAALTMGYDELRRLGTVNNGVFTSTYSYCDDAATGKASPRLKSIVHEGVNFSGKTIECNYTYGYDENGNITSAAFGKRNHTYVYDDNNQLIRENNDRRQYTQTWEYDEFGNITRTRKYAYTTGELDPTAATSTVEYGYTDSAWGDLLTQYNGQAIEYDNIGNPLYVRDAENNVVKSYTWTQGRQMATHMTKGVTWSYTYDADGLRTGRTDGTNTYEYIYAGDKLVRMVKNGEVVDFGYAGGRLTTMTYDGTTYYYVLNGQGDVVALVDGTGTMIVGYHYSAYGNPVLLKTDYAAYTDLKYLNPFLYRGYVYDIETSLYYLQSRYYDPELGRFINADAYASTGQGVLGNNMFAYCCNNPICYVDSCGYASNICFSDDEDVLTMPWEDSMGGGGGVGYLIAIGGTAIVTSLFINSLEHELARKLAKSYKKSANKIYKTDEEVHHIVPKGSHYTTLSTAIVNIVIPYGVENPINKISIDTGLHRHLHTSLYYGIVNTSIVGAYLSGKSKTEQTSNVATAIMILRGLVAFLDVIIPNSGG